MLVGLELQEVVANVVCYELGLGTWAAGELGHLGWVAMAGNGPAYVNRRHVSHVVGKAKLSMYNSFQVVCVFAVGVARVVQVQQQGVFQRVELADGHATLGKVCGDALKRGRLVQGLVACPFREIPLVNIGVSDFGSDGFKLHLRENEVNQRRGKLSEVMDLVLLSKAVGFRQRRVL